MQIRPQGDEKGIASDPTFAVWHIIAYRYMWRTYAHYTDEKLLNMTGSLHLNNNREDLFVSGPVLQEMRHMMRCERK